MTYRTTGFGWLLHETTSSFEAFWKNQNCRLFGFENFQKTGT
jgi:hypothetical protein